MIKKICHYVWDEFKGNKLYDLSDPTLNQDNRLRSFSFLKIHFEKLGIEMNTQDITSPENADLILFENCPAKGALEKIFAIKKLNKIMYLTISESIFILPSNNNPSIHALFDKIFTYQDQYLDDIIYFKFNYTFAFPTTIPRYVKKHKKLLCMIGRNKRVTHKGELYSERVKVIRWYEKNASKEFSLYGEGWERPWKVAGPWFRRKVLNKWPFRPFFAKPFKCWKGQIESKAETMMEYKFSLCFENAADVSGYITEKIFDAMLAGCVPIYRGADNIAKHIPSNCFIDYRNFKNIEEMHKNLISMKEEEYVKFLDAIEDFFNSKAADQFRYAHFVNSISIEVSKEI